MIHCVHHLIPTQEKAEIEGSCREQLETIQREEQLKVLSLNTVVVPEQ